MKKLLYILPLMLMIFLAGCGETDMMTATETAAGTDPHDRFSEMASLYIDAEEIPGEDYSEAFVTAEWTGKSVLEEPVQIKLRGNSGKESEKKSYNIKFEDEIALLGMDKGKKWALVGNPFDKSLLRPVIGFDYAEMLGMAYTPDTRLCNVWMNDCYMGVYTVIEPVEAGGGRVEIDAESGDFLLERNIGRTEEDKFYVTSPIGYRFEFNEPEEPDAQQQDACRRMLQQAEEAIFTKNHNVYEKYIDVNSFVNFYIFNELIKDIDFGEYSTRYYFRDGIMYAGPPWDLDLTQGNVSAEKSELKYRTYNNIESGDGSGDSTKELWVDVADYYYWLCRDPWFSNLVKQRWQAVSDLTENLTTDNELGKNLIDCYLEVHIDHLENNYTEAGWNVAEAEHVSEWHTPEDTYIGNVELLRQWIMKRKSYLDSQFMGGFSGNYCGEPWSSETLSVLDN